MRYLGIFLLAGALLSMSSCRSTKMDKLLLYHNMQLRQLAQKKIPASEKVDVLAALMVEALEESLQFSKTSNSVKFLKAYTKQNKESVDLIYSQISDWYTGLSSTEKLIATARLGTKPYVRQLFHLVPKVENKLQRKLKTIFFLSRFTKLLNLI